jgi:hypothetical protein
VNKETPMSKPLILLLVSDGDVLDFDGMKVTVSDGAGIASVAPNTIELSTTGRIVCHQCHIGYRDEPATCDHIDRARAALATAVDRL